MPPTTPHGPDGIQAQCRALPSNPAGDMSRIGWASKSFPNHKSAGEAIYQYTIDNECLRQMARSMRSVTVGRERGEGVLILAYRQGFA